MVPPMKHATARTQAPETRAARSRDRQHQTLRRDTGRVYITLITRLRVIGAVFALAACPDRVSPAVDAGIALDAGRAAFDAGVAELVDAGPPQPAELAIVVTTTAADGGFELIDRDIDPVQRMSIWIPVVLADYRLRVFDEADRVVPSDDLAKETDGGIDYQVAFVEPLKTGRNYRLTIESQSGQTLDGFRDAELLFKVRGEVQREPKKPAGGGKKKKR